MYFVFFVGFIGVTPADNVIIGKEGYFHSEGIARVCILSPYLDFFQSVKLPMMLSAHTSGLSLLYLE